MSKLTAVLPLQEIHGLGVGGGVGVPERDLPYKSLSLSLASDLKQVSSPEADELKQVSLRGATAHNYWLEHGLMNAEVHDGKQFTPSPHMSAFSLLQKPLQMGATSSSSSSLINKQEIIGRVKEKHESYEEMKIGVDTEHGGIVGRADEKRDIMKLIMSHGPSNKRFTIICITGGHGLGKTTLASLVYWDDTMCRSFEARAWMCSSHVTDIEELLRSTVSSLTGVSCRLNDRDELEELVKEELMGKKFLLVLDDLHENNVEICRRLILLLSVGDKGSAVMVTTSTNMVVGSLGTAHAYNLKPFMHDEFLNMATPHSVQYSPLKSIVSRMPSEFFGFPTFAKAIRGIIYSAFTREHLELDECLGVTLDGMLTDILNKPDNLLDNLLCLSYSYLRPNQQRCHAYCSLFPKHYTYNKEKLLRLWMSQGFIIPDREKDRDGDREDAFDELLHRSFFDHCPASDFKEQKYVMHEFSSHAARTASGEKFFRAHDHELDCIPKDVHHLSIIPKQCDSEIYFSSFTEFRHLSTFLLVYNSQLDSSDSQFHVMDVKALDECFHNFRCLKTLDLSHTDIKELPESIGHMTSMCFLGLNNTNLRRLPNSMCNLLKLQTLELQNSAFLVELPNNIKYLNSLHHLDASKEHGPIYVPPGIGQLKNLRTLTTFTVGGVSWSCKLSELAQLNSLRGSLHIQCLNDVENAGDAEGACLAAKKLNKLSLEWCYSGEDVESEDQICVAEHVLDALKPHSLLGELNIKGYYGLDLPSWMADHTLSDLSSITLDNCYNCKKLPPLGTLPALRSLFLQNLRAVQVISYEFYGNATINHKSFPKLETLKLRDMYNLEGWHDILLVGDFPLLHSLSIERCPKLRSIPRFQFISNASIMSCSRLNLPGLKSLQTLKFGNLKQGKCFTLSCELSSLLMLELICCEHLCSVEGLSRLQSLKHLKFRGCPRLNFDQDEPLPYTLETVDVHSNCYALINWRPHGFEELLDASEVCTELLPRFCNCISSCLKLAIILYFFGFVYRLLASVVPELLSFQNF